MHQVLPDVLGPGLKLVFCGSAAGTASARKKAYYAGPGNRFWKTLYDIGLTPRRLEPHEFVSVLDFGIGLTDVAKTVFGSDHELPRHAFDAHGLRNKIAQLAPGALAFNGKRSACEFFGVNKVGYGRQNAGIGRTVVFVLPSTSGAARRFWDVAHWSEVAQFVMTSVKESEPKSWNTRQPNDTP